MTASQWNLKPGSVYMSSQFTFIGLGICVDLRQLQSNLFETNGGIIAIHWSWLLHLSLNYGAANEVHTLHGKWCATEIKWNHTAQWALWTRVRGGLLPTTLLSPFPFSISLSRSPSPSLLICNRFSSICSSIGPCEQFKAADFNYVWKRTKVNLPQIVN